PRESFQVALVKFSGTSEKPTFRMSVVYQGLDTLSIREGESAILLIDGDRQTLRTFARPLQKVFSDGSTSMSMYEMPASVARSIASAKAVRLRVRTESGDRDFVFAPTNFCSFGRFYTEAIAAR